MEGGGGPFICGRDETGRTDTVSCLMPAPAEAEVPVSVGSPVGHPWVTVAWVVLAGRGR